jgi:hypothetical protein
MQMHMLGDLRMDYCRCGHDEESHAEPGRVFACDVYGCRCRKYIKKNTTLGKGRKYLVREEDEDDSIF